MNEDVLRMEMGKIGREEVEVVLLPRYGGQKAEHYATSVELSKRGTSFLPATVLRALTSNPLADHVSAPQSHQKEVVPCKQSRRAN